MLSLHNSRFCVVLCLYAGLILNQSLVNAGFSATSAKNVAIYWGQNSAGTSTSQARLSTYCANSELNIIPLAFLTHIITPTLNLASAQDLCTAIAGSSLFYCSQVEADIATCQQKYGKTILLSIGGDTYTEGGFPSSSAATSAATTIWSIFGPNTATNTGPRPFGNSVVDGFDFDFESGNQNMVPFAAQLRTLMDTATKSGGKQYFLTAAPQCVYPDYADNAMLDGAIFFDAIFIQFYNNGCGANSYVPGAATQWNFNFDVWDKWAKTVSLNPNVKLLLGVPGSAAAGGGYMSGSAVGSVITFSKTFSNFGGVMIWDMSQTFANAGLLDTVSGYLGSSGSSPPPVTSSPGTSSTTFSTQLSGTPTTSSTGPISTLPLVGQWNQCGGMGWGGGTVCMAPYICVALSVWYSMCE